MLANAARDAPIGRFDIARIGALAEQTPDALMTDQPGVVLRKERVVLEKAHHFRLRLEAARGVAFERFADHGRDRLLPLEHLPAPGHLLIAIAERSLEDPIAILNARPHPVLGLLAVLAAMMLGDSGEQILDQLGIRIVAELDGGRFQNAARIEDRGAQLDMRLDVAGKSGDVIDDDDDALGAALAQMREHGLHAGPLRQASRYVIAEYIGDGIMLHAREVAAARLLRLQAIADRALFDAGYAAVNDRFFLIILAHAMIPYLARSRLRLVVLWCLTILHRPAHLPNPLRNRPEVSHRDRR